MKSYFFQACCLMVEELPTVLMRKKMIEAMSMMRATTAQLNRIFSRTRRMWNSSTVIYKLLLYLKKIQVHFVLTEIKDDVVTEKFGDFVDYCARQGDHRDRHYYRQDA